MTTRKVIITSIDAKLANHHGSQCLILNVSELTTKTKKSQLYVYTENAADLESYLPFIQIGQTLTIPNEPSVKGVIKIIQKFYSPLNEFRRKVMRYTPRPYIVIQQPSTT